MNHEQVKALKRKNRRRRVARHYLWWYLAPFALGYLIGMLT